MSFVSFFTTKMIATHLRTFWKLDLWDLWDLRVAWSRSRRSSWSVRPSCTEPRERRFLRYRPRNTPPATGRPWKLQIWKDENCFKRNWLGSYLTRCLGTNMIRFLLLKYRVCQGLWLTYISMSCWFWTRANFCQWANSPYNVALIRSTPKSNSF